MPNPDKLIPASDAALRTGYSRDRIVRAIQSGRIPGVKEDGHYFADADAVDELARERGRATSAA